MIVAGSPPGSVIDIRSIEVGFSFGVDLKSVVEVGAGLTIIDRPIDPQIVEVLKAGRITIIRDVRIPQIRRHIAAVVVAVMITGYASAGCDVTPAIAVGGVIDVVNALLIGSPGDAAVVSVVGGRGDA